MTNEKASIIVGNLPINGDECYSISEYQQAKAMAIKALEQQACEDCISRQAVLDQIYLWRKDEFLRVTNPFDYLNKRINSLSLVTPPPKIGRWAILKDEYGDIVDAVCSCCDEHGNHEWTFCPHCGARMEADNGKDGL
jgi:hypothetical protein